MARLNEVRAPELAHVEIDAPGGHGARATIRLNGQEVMAKSVKITLGAEDWNLVEIVLPARVNMAGLARTDIKADVLVIPPRVPE